MDNLGACGWLQGKAVLDVGCGTGVLAMFGLMAGAGKAIGVDSSRTVHDATAVSMANGFGDGTGSAGPLRLIRSRLEDLPESELPPCGMTGASHGGAGGVDVLVSEWMGYALLFESMLTSVLVARDRFLRPGGVLMPDSATIFVEAVCDPCYHRRHVGFWGDVYGLDMGALEGRSAERPHVGVVPQAAIGSDRAIARRFDLLAVRDEELDFESDLVLRNAKRTFMNRPSPTALPGAVVGTSAHMMDIVYGLAISFDTGFDARPFPGPPSPSASGSSGTGAADLPGKPPSGYSPVNLSTRPDESPTHWA